MKNFVDNLNNFDYTIKGIEAWLSLVERCVRDAEAASSNLVASIGALQQRSRSWPHGQAVKTTPSHGVNPGSIPGQVTKDKLLDCQQLVLRNTKKQGGNMFCLDFRAVCYCSAVGSATDS